MPWTPEEKATNEVQELCDGVKEDAMNNIPKDTTVNQYRALKYIKELGKHRCIHRIIKIQINDGGNPCIHLKISTTETCPLETAYVDIQNNKREVDPITPF